MSNNIQHYCENSFDLLDPVNGWTLELRILRRHGRTVLNHTQGSWMQNDKGTLVMKWALRFRFCISCFFLSLALRGLNQTILFKKKGKQFCYTFPVSWHCSFWICCGLRLILFLLGNDQITRGLLFSCKFMMFIQGLKISEDIGALRKDHVIVIKVVPFVENVLKPMSVEHRVRI